MLNNSDKTKEKANEIDQATKTVLTEMLVQDLCTIAHYDSGIGPENQTLLSRNLPPSLYLGPPDILYNQSINIIKDETCLTRMKLYIGLFHWNEGNRGNGLSNIASGCEYWLTLLSEGVPSCLGSDVVLCFASVVEVMCDSLQKYTHSSILHYLYYIYLDNSDEKENKKRKETLMEKYPVLATLKDIEFEKSLMSKNLELEAKRNLLKEFILKNVDRTFDHSNVKTESKPSSPKHGFP